MSALGVLIDEIGNLALLVAEELGLAPESVEARVAALVFRSAGDVVREVTADDIERIRKARELGEASGAAALRASSQNFLLKCAHCRAPVTQCDRGLFVFGVTKANASLLPVDTLERLPRCCEFCHHPEFWET